MIRVCLLLALVLFGLFSNIFFSPVAFAQSEAPPTQSSSEELADYLLPETAPDVEKNSGTFVQSVLFGIGSTVMCALSGVDLLDVNGKGCVSYDPVSRTLGYTNSGNGAIGMVSGFMAYTYRVPVSGSAYVSHMASKFGVAKSAYAQDEVDGARSIGFVGLEPVREIWDAVRSIVYLVFVIVFIVIGVGIMLRLQIDPRTVMTVQNQIPKIIIGLVLVTFSYAIAGFLVDLMFVLVALLLDFFTGGSDPLLAGTLPSPYTSPFAFVNELFIFKQLPDQPLAQDFLIGSFEFDTGILQVAGLSAASVGIVIANIAGGLFEAVITAIFTSIGGFLNPLNPACDLLSRAPDSVGIPGTGIGFGIPGIDSDCFVGEAAGKIGQVLGFTLASILAFVIVLVAILWSLVRLWFLLLKAYVMILVGVILAPLWIILGLLPGSEQGFGSWLRHMASNILVFPAVVAIFLLARTIMGNFAEQGIGSINEIAGIGAESGKGFVPPLVSHYGTTDALGAMIGLAFILLAPSTVQMLQKALKAPDSGLTSAIGQAIGQGATAASFAPKRIAHNVFKPPDQHRPAGSGYQWLTGARHLGQDMTEPWYKRWAGRALGDMFGR